MILINKSTEPKSWKKYRKTPGVKYQSSHDLVDSLLKEQGYICAYCMRKVPCRDKLYEKDGTTYVLTQEDHRVEHILSREKHSDWELDYSNMVLCCPGHIGADEHCDRLKGDNDISFSPTDPMFISTIKYKATGEIISSNDQWNTEINNLLNLNTDLLVKNRASALSSVIALINRECKGRVWNLKMLNKYLDKYKNKHRGEDGELRYKQFCGIVVYYMNKKLKQIE